MTWDVFGRTADYSGTGAAQKDYRRQQDNIGISVSVLNQLITDSLRRTPALRNVCVTAEISSFKHHVASGHWYFSLKDESAAISCVMFRQNNLHAALKPRDGDRVTVIGSVEFYGRDGKTQLYVTEMKAAGIGSLYERFELLKQKLGAEGLFDQSRKKLLPQVPGKVAVITSASGAALHDILNVSGQRSPGISILLIPSAVQGAGAAGELAAAIEKVSRMPDIDVVIIGRGGGSAEDLWCFNEEILARAIAACPVPVVSGVGHETDFTICDYVADVRASTPSNAAEIVFPDREELMGRVQYFRTSLGKVIYEQVQNRLLRVHESRNRLQRHSPERVLQRLSEKSRLCRQRLNSVICEAIRKCDHRLESQSASISLVMERKISLRENTLHQMKTKLNAISPLRVLERGYVLVYDEKDRVLASSASARYRHDMRLRFYDGMVEVLRKEH